MTMFCLKSLGLFRLGGWLGRGVSDAAAEKARYRPLTYSKRVTTCKMLARESLGYRTAPKAFTD